MLVNVRFSDDSGLKRRPAVVVSVDAVHESRADALIVPLTTNVAVQRYGDHLLSDWEAVGLPRASMAKGVVETVERSTFDRMLGSISGRHVSSFEANLRDLLGL